MTCSRRSSALALAFRSFSRRASRELLSGGGLGGGPPLPREEAVRKADILFVAEVIPEGAFDVREDEEEEELDGGVGFLKAFNPSS